MNFSFGYVVYLIVISAVCLLVGVAILLFVGIERHRNHNVGLTMSALAVVGVGFIWSPVTTVIEIILTILLGYHTEINHFVYGLVAGYLLTMKDIIVLMIFEEWERINSPDIHPR